MKQQQLEVIFNNGDIRQVLLLPETPIKMIFIFGEKELVLREKLGVSGVYVISHQRGFSETGGNCESDQELEIISQNESSDVNQTQSGENLSLLPVKNITRVIKPVKKVTHDERQAICGEIIYSAKQNEETVQQSTTKQNRPIVYQLELDVAQSKNNSVHTECSTVQPEKSSTQSESNDNTNCNQKGNTLDREEIHNNETPVLNSDSDEGFTMDFESRCSDISDDEGRVNSFNKESSSTSLVENKSKQIGSIQSEQEQTAETVLPVKHTIKHITKCAICNKRKEAGQVYNSFPSDPNTSEKWAKFVTKKYILKAAAQERKRRYFVCFRHFNRDDYKGSSSTRLKPGVVPSRNLPNIPESKIPEKQAAETFGRLKTKIRLALHKKTMIESALSSPDAAAKKKPKKDAAAKKKKQEEDDLELSINRNIIYVDAAAKKKKQEEEDLELAINRNIIYIPADAQNKKEEDAVAKMMQLSRYPDLSCCVPKCLSCKSKTPEYYFLNFPPEDSVYNIKRGNVITSFNLREEWIKLLNIEQPITNDMKVCSRHFLKSDFFPQRNKYVCPELRKNVIPTQYLPLALPEIQRSEPVE